MKLAFSTVACPEWTLDQVVSFAASSEYDGVELRTFGFGSSKIACDPALTAASKLRALMDEAGVVGASLATGCRFDEPIFPPVIGRVISDTERSVREAKSAIQMAAALDVPFVRVFAFEFQRGDNPKLAERRIINRLRSAIDAARNTGVKVVLENGGSYPGAKDIARIIAEINHPLLGAAYSPMAALAARESAIEGAEILGDRLWMVKLKDERNGEPCVIGDGDLGCRAFVEHLARRQFSGWGVVEWDRLWIDGLAAPEGVLSTAAERLRVWSASTRGGRRVGAAWA